MRERLYRTAVALFRTRGFEATTVQDITEAADTAKGTFFTYFASKGHVLAAYHDEMTGTILSVVDAVPHPSAADALLHAASECGGWVARDAAMARVVIRTLFGTPALAAADHANGRRFVAWLSRVVTDAVGRGEFRRDTDVESFVALFLAAVNGAVIDWAAGPVAAAGGGGDSAHAEELLSALARRVTLLLRAVQAPSAPGHGGPT